MILVSTKISEKSSEWNIAKVCSIAGQILRGVLNVRRHGLRFETEKYVFHILLHI